MSFLAIFRPFFSKVPNEFKLLVITGFNTDIQYDGVTYHVQTEDKGLDTPLILSLIYQGGTILASKRSPYDDLIRGGFDEKVLAERLNRQHKLLCAAVRAGRIEDLKRMTMRESAEKKNLIVKKEIEQPHEKERKVETEAAVEKSFSIQKSLPSEKSIPAEKSIPKPSGNFSSDRASHGSPGFLSESERSTDDSNGAYSPPTARDRAASSEELKHVVGLDFDIPVIEDVQIIEAPTVFEPVDALSEEEIILPPDAVEIVSDLSRFESLVGDELKIKFLGEDVFRSGESKTVNILVFRGKNETAVTDANVMIKVIGSSFRPLIFHSKTDSNGIASFILKIPTFRTGRAAILVRAIIKGEETETRRVINHER